MEEMQKKILGWVAGVLILISGAIVFFLSFTLNSQYSYEALKVVFVGDRALLYTHVITNMVIGIAYMLIPLTLMQLVKKTGKRIPFTWTFFAFGVFIVGCGFTHFMATWTTWSAVWWLAQIVNWATAVVSILTAILIIPIVPKVVTMVEEAALSEERKSKLETSNKELAEANEKFAKEVEERKAVQKKLEDTKTALLNALEDKGGK